LNVAVHYNRPVMVGPAPVLRETVQKADIGVACRSASPQDLAKGIDCMVERTSNGYSQSLEAYRQHHSWEENARRTLEVYRTVIGVEK
jgi:glycosyltransferase involved in cell wall biosynthesis